MKTPSEYRAISESRRKIIIQQQVNIMLQDIERAIDSACLRGDKNCCSSDSGGYYRESLDEVVNALQHRGFKCETGYHTIRVTWDK